MAKFKPGDRVVRIQITEEGMVPVGFTGTFLGYDDVWILCGEHAAMVCWDGILPENGHDCNGLCEYGTGWCIPEQDLQLIITELDENDYDVSDITSMINSMFGGGSD